MIDWQHIDTVLLDMDGTLLDLHFDNYFWMQYVPQAYAREHQLSEAESTERLHSKFEQNQSSLNWYSVDYWSEQLQLDIPALKREVQHMVAMRPHVEEFLTRLHASHRDVVMVTNAHRKTLDIKMDRVDITGWFDRIVVSHDLDAPKEEQAFWHRLQALHPFDPARTLFIDDTERVLESARDYGIAHLLTLLQPDSQRQKRIDTRFPGIHHFDEIMPDQPPP
ncbi:haloacid dehalogenase [Halioglobus japonicus]|uniref:GMP/IMP nucleotidase n=1 Tax=Halioglobus japonicus TaxID=930805 RepID=A0AAP8SM62_9GAMM|nr:GMP/IMP nucleotidase [Halioglobus japonicus]PLW84708.1 GMP/IMP nucleotidase [Halioglobus japonicus]GHD21008.1 haloacid dehalogenase [Halioglobus japonicus]